MALASVGNTDRNSRVERLSDHQVGGAVADPQWIGDSLSQVQAVVQSIQSPQVIVDPASIQKRHEALGCATVMAIVAQTGVLSSISDKLEEMCALLERLVDRDTV